MATIWVLSVNTEYSTGQWYCPRKKAHTGLAALEGFDQTIIIAHILTVATQETEEQSTRPAGQFATTLSQSETEEQQHCTCLACAKFYIQQVPQGKEREEGRLEGDRKDGTEEERDGGTSSGQKRKKANLRLAAKTRSPGMTAIQAPFLSINKLQFILQDQTLLPSSEQPGSQPPDWLR